MAVGLLTLMKSLALKKSPQVVYSYRLKPIVRVGVLSMSAVLLTYGYTFADVSWLSAKQRQAAAEDDDKRSVWYFCKSYGPVALAVLPFTLSLGTLYVFSRVVRQVIYLPDVVGKPGCRIVRQSPLLAREISTVRPLDVVSRTKGVRIYTGKGPQGIDDAATFSFYLVDKTAKSFWNRYYILPRSGEVWKSDGRVLDSLFHNDLSKNSLEEFEDRSTLAKEVPLKAVLKQNKTSFHSNANDKSDRIKSIVTNSTDREQR
ncbi:Mrx15p KNAG_0D00280 [Huiozyma naganishii CBS 8797]|uniref:Uncharacterized protein n=1 Tax=Huiozyma naganishii (strain ATCC MYA-139 / BCRC 22969 / CBS 8797 / KCTC 17520 / NBRC 10181 / NCYC 3082 / Yp74L-3) TaxID=1071383 RepID=J7S6I4_HUIN7|nr:hypothetical protein KNAG_0D00280 [Kazachstania naganishii CBS 8797]CCK69781.1 hypothetical protein KNAG_0D00280 [Kazachstania naganishii CBS 8797]